MSGHIVHISVAIRFQGVGQSGLGWIAGSLGGVSRLSKFDSIEISLLDVLSGACNGAQMVGYLGREFTGIYLSFPSCVRIIYT